MSQTERKALRNGEFDRGSRRLTRLEARRRRTSQLLRRQTDFTTVVLDAVTDLVVELDGDGCITRFNRACRVLTGYTLAEVRGRRPWEFLVPSEEAEEFRRACGLALPSLSEAISSGPPTAPPLSGLPEPHAPRPDLARAPQRHENHWITKAGGRRRVGWSCVRLAAPAGQAFSSVISATDITEQHAAHDMSALYEQRLNALLDLTQRACDLSEREIVELTLEEAVRLTQSRVGYLHFIDTQRQMIELFAWSRETLQQCEAVQREHYPMAKAGVWADAVRLKQPVVHNDLQSLPGRQGCPLGHVPLTRHMSIPVLEGENVVVVLGVGNKPADYNSSDVRQLRLMGDQLWRIVRRKRSERMLQESEERYRTLVETSPDAIVLVDTEGRFLAANPQFFHLSGFASLQEIEKEGLQAFDFFVADDAERARAECRRILADGTASDGEYLVRRRDGSTYFAEVTSSVVRNDQGEPSSIMALIRDITHRRRLEDELHAHVRALEEEDRHKDEFLAMLAHELRNPLAPISSAVDLLSLPQAPPEMTNPARQIMRHQLEHLVRLVDDLLDVSRITRGKIELRCEVIDLTRVVANAMEISRALIESRGHRLTLRKPAQPVYVHGDPVRLAQVVANLLNNAAKYTREGGQIWLTLGMEQDQAVIRVRDTGLGISAQALPRVWEPFVQGHTSLDRAHGGLGLGLTLVRHLVELHGGQVEAFSPGLNRGTEFVVHLPLSAGPPAPPAQSPPSANILSAAVDTSQPQSATSPLRVLVVDDNVDAALLLSVLLTGYGYQVETADDGPSALEIAQSFRPQAVLLDIGLPGMDGYEVARVLRQDRAADGMLIVAVSGYGHAEARRRSQEVGIDHHLVKPVNPQRLLKLLAERAKRHA